MKILFLNTWYFTRENEIRQFFDEYIPHTDIFCLQEVYGKSRPMCQGIFSDYQEVFDTKTIDDCIRYAQGTYVKKDIQIHAQKTILQNDSATGLGLHTTIKYNGTLVHICNVHGVPIPGDKKDTAARIRQSQEIIDAYKDVEGLKIIGGDFNIDKETKSTQAFKEQGYHDLIREYNIPTTRNRLCWDKYPTEKLYYSDFVFINDVDSIVDFQVPSIEVSDHLPMILDINI